MTSKEIVLRPRTPLVQIEPRAIARRATKALVIGRTYDDTYHEHTTFRSSSDDFVAYDSLHTWWVGMPGYQRQYLYIEAFVLPATVIKGGTMAIFMAGLQTSVITAWMTTILWGLIPWCKHRRVYVKPLVVVLNALFKQDYMSYHNVARVPRNFGHDKSAPTRIYLPAHQLIDDGIKKKVQSAVAMKLGISELTVEWKTVGARPCAHFKPMPRPPQRVDWEDVRELALGLLSDSVIFVGLGRGRKPVCFDLGNESPHLAISGGSNSGKSVLLRTLLAQAAHTGSRAVIFDVKRVSHKWAKNLPGIEYYRDVSEIHDALVSIAALELRKRTKLADNDEDPGRRIFVVLEEMNTLMLQLRRYWRNLGEKGPSPAVEAISDLLCMGREVKINVVVAAQNLTARSIGGPEARENFSTRALARYSPQMWNMLCGDVRPMPAKSRRVGVWQIVFAGEAHETQVAFMTPEEARQLALSASNPAPAKTVSVDSDISCNATSEAHGTVDTIDAEVVSHQFITLEEASKSLSGSALSYHTLRVYRSKDSKFPPVRGRRGRADTYFLDELEDWKLRRDANKESRE